MKSTNGGVNGSKWKKVFRIIKYFCVARSSERGQEIRREKEWEKILE